MRQIAILFCAFAILAGCEQGVPKDALQLSATSLQDRQLQTRRFDTREEAKILAASAALLQDLGFNLDESETRLGVVVASKKRDATEAGQVAGAIILAVLTGVATPIDKHQLIRASVITRPADAGAEYTIVRVTFQRVVWNTQNQVTKQEFLNDPEAYQEFFSKLSTSVFLEAHQI